MAAPRVRHRPRSRHEHRGGWRLRGEGPVEFAILAFPFLLFTFMLIQAALVWYAHSVALGAATQGANTGRLYGAPVGAGSAKAGDFLDRIGPALTDTTVTTTVGGNVVTVTVRGKARSVIPGMTFSVTQSASGPVERFVP